MRAADHHAAGHAADRQREVEAGSHCWMLLPACASDRRRFTSTAPPSSRVATLSISCHMPRAPKACWISGASRTARSVFASAKSRRTASTRSAPCAEAFAASARAARQTVAPNAALGGPSGPATFIRAKSSLTQWSSRKRTRCASARRCCQQQLPSLPSWSTGTRVRSVRSGHCTPRSGTTPQMSECFEREPHSNQRDFL